LEIEADFRDLDEVAVFEPVGDPGPPIRGYSDEFLAFFPLAIAEIFRHLALDVRQLLGEIALGFENGPADQRVETAAHHGDPALEIEGRQVSAEFTNQQLPEIRLDLVMARFSCKMAQKIYRGLASHRLNLAGTLQSDNPEAKQCRDFSKLVRSARIFNLLAMAILATAI
jgi:hypothetical protein